MAWSGHVQTCDLTITAVRDAEASVWSGRCDDIPAAADAPTLDELMAKISAMALDLLSENHLNSRSPLDRLHATEIVTDSRFTRPLRESPA